MPSRLCKVGEGRRRCVDVALTSPRVVVKRGGENEGEGSELSSSSAVPCIVIVVIVVSLAVLPRDPHHPPVVR